MRIIKNQKTQKNNVYGTYIDNTIIDSVLDLNPDVLVQVENNYFVGGGLLESVASFKLLNQAADSTIVPGGVRHPYSENSGKSLRFGYGNDLSDFGANGFLRSKRPLNIDMRGNYTIGVVARRPTTTDIPIGNRGGPVVGNASGAFSGLFFDLNSPNVASAYHSGNFVFASIGMTDGNFAAVSISFDSANMMLHMWIDGVYKGSNSAPVNWGLSKDLIFGMSENFVFRGEIAAIFVKAGSFYGENSTEITALNIWLNGVKDTR